MGRRKRVEFRTKLATVPDNANSGSEDQLDNTVPRVGIDIKRNSGGSSSISNSSSGHQHQQHRNHKINDSGSTFLVGNPCSVDDLVSRYAEYGSTPPRTRIKNKTRDWDRKQRQMEATSTLKMKIANNNSRMSRSRANRRNTMDCALLNEMFVEDETKRSDKRAITLQREADRDSKLSMMVGAGVGSVVGQAGPTTVTSTGLTSVPGNGQVTLRAAEDRVESLPGNWRPNRGTMIVGTGTNANNVVIESANRYMCVQSRPVEQIGSRMSAPPATFLKESGAGLGVGLKVAGLLGTPVEGEKAKVVLNRKDFHDTFANLIKLGSTDKQDNKLSQEEHKYQTELMDLIWLELQAWHADRTLDQQDKFLYAARQNVGDLLQEIMDYRFVAKYSRNVSVVSDDSGFAPDSAESNSGQEFKFPNNDLRFYSSSHCTGCLSMYCKDCMEQQALALRQVEGLLNRLEAAEALFPSTNAMGYFFPLYKEERFVGRLKAMCLWYNITRHQRLKLMILGKVLARLQERRLCWPVAVSQAKSTHTSPTDTADSGRDSNESKRERSCKPGCKVVTFNVDEISTTSDSGTSTESVRDDYYSGESANDFGKWVTEASFFNVQSLTPAAVERSTSNDNPYRKYIENVLKSRGLGRSLSFLHRVHNMVVRKAHVALQKTDSDESDFDDSIYEDEMQDMEVPLDKEEEAELRRYGVWSKEYAELNLPSYASAFIFLSLIPMEVIHEFLRMKLESRPVIPNPLSVEQLLKELREGIILAIMHRDRFHRHISTALMDREVELEKYLKIMHEFNNTLKTILGVYLDYVHQMIMAAIPEKQQKAVLDREWIFTKLVCPMVPGQHAVAANKFCEIVNKLLSDIGVRLVERGTELDTKILETEPGAREKLEILSICRETQSLFTEEREKSMKVMTFAKGLVRDIEHSDFHRDHSEEFLSGCKGNDFVCDAVRDAVWQLKTEALKVRDKLTQVVERVQERCDIKNMGDLDEVDKTSVLSRTREILHQGYKFGFDYHRDLMRLMETKTVSCKNSSKEFNLSLGIIEFAKLWMRFVMERCERGRGLRPRWAAQGFDFLILACDPVNSKHLSDKDFKAMERMMDACVSHVIGVECAEPQRKRPSPRSRKNSPAHRPSPTTPPLLPHPVSPGALKLGNQLSLSTKSLFPQTSLFEHPVGLTPTGSVPQSPEIIRKQQSCDNSSAGGGTTIRVPVLGSYTQPLRAIRVRDAVNRLDMELEESLREKNLIGNVKALNVTDKMQIRAKSVTFRWHRGIKIGQGRFGKVYTAVNNSTGELMAMKEITIQPGENRAIQKVAEELKIFEGITHKHLVKYYGVEIHREELLIFMELCAEGTLESLVELSGALHEGLTRRYTVQLLSAVAELHTHGIVHRDIKSANIFLTNSANCLKLGDFGSAVKIQSHTTVAGEVVGLVGTQAYMAPEVFTKTDTEGHGRAVDIWSVGCVVIEMASGKRPWSQFESTVQIMFRVGMGARPEIPEELSQEGHDFLDACLQHEPKNRPPASTLLHHNFCKVAQDDNCLCNDNDVRRSTMARRKSKSVTPPDLVK